MTVLAALLPGATAACLILWRGGRTVDWGLWSCLAWAVFTVWQLQKSSPQCGSYPAVSETCCVAECLKNTTLPWWWIAVLSVTSVAKRWWPAGFDPFMQYLYVWFFLFFFSLMWSWSPHSRRYLYASMRWHTKLGFISTSCWFAGSHIVRISCARPHAWGLHTWSKLTWLDIYI